MKALVKLAFDRLGRHLFYLTVAGVILVITGCSDYSGQNDLLRSQLQEKDKQNTTLRETLSTVREENAQCQQQVVNLQNLTPQQRAEAISTVTEVSIVARSGIYDAKTPGKEPRLLIYFRPLDDTGDTIKAPGAVHIELWDLGAAAPQALLAKWDITPLELKKCWSSSLLSNFYRLSFPVPTDYAARKELTAKVVFTDHFTGKSYSMQNPITSK
jgi:hypothetical protein